MLPTPGALRSLLLVLTGGLLGACAEAEGEPVKPAHAPAPAPAPAEGPLVIELFTSQGCSSCPSADQLLGKLARAGQLGGRAVVPLSFHVDYWNDLGWSDPYSLPAWTERQHRYAGALGEARVYTPALVVGGAAAMVGSNTLAVSQAIADAPRVALLPATARWTAEHVEITTTAPAGADVLIAVFEEARRVKVTRGENAGATLANHRIVRRLERVAAAGQRGTLRVALDPAWRELGAVVFAQRPDQRIVAATLVPRR
ncbi:MAG: DUF1223 domain-containing protein [Myxococcota bacterium]|nr:DUF1223 domain-containing protein [Myxococcota bacterium]